MPNALNAWYQQYKLASMLVQTWRYDLLVTCPAEHNFNFRDHVEVATKSDLPMHFMDAYSRTFRSLDISVLVSVQT